MGRRGPWDKVAWGEGVLGLGGLGEGVLGLGGLGGRGSWAWGEGVLGLARTWGAWGGDISML